MGDQHGPDVARRHCSQLVIVGHGGYFEGLAHLGGEGSDVRGRQLARLGYLDPQRHGQLAAWNAPRGLGDQDLCRPFVSEERDPLPGLVGMLGIGGNRPRAARR